MSQGSTVSENPDRARFALTDQNKADLAQSAQEQSLRVGQAEEAQAPELEQFFEQALQDIEGWTVD